MWSRYFSSALRPDDANRYFVFARRPENDLVQAIYPASPSFRAWTLRLPSETRSSSLSSLNVSDVFTASALTIASRVRSWIRRSRLAAAVSAGRALGTPRFGFSSRAARKAPGLAAIFPRNHGPEKNVKSAES